MKRAVVTAVESVAADIASMEGRGATTVADALAARTKTSDAETADSVRIEMHAAAGELYDTRPTAVSLANAPRFVFQGMDGTTVEELRRSAVDAAEIEMCDEAEVIDDETRADVRKIAVENPAFDVTPPQHLDAIVAERGQCPPEGIVTLLCELFGEATVRPWEGPA
jgi:translation initiation factor 2B subunit (eIF-2B alpha/beta/delta family)